MSNVFFIGNPCNNIGDEASMKGAIYGLTRYVDNCKLILSKSGSLDKDGIAQFVTETIEDESFFSSKNIIKFSFQVFLKNNTSASRAFNDSNIIVFAPGSCGIHKRNYAHWIKVLIMVILCRIRKKKVAFYAPSMGPFENRHLRILKYIINNVDVLTLRDNTSIQNLKDTRVNFRAVFNTVGDI